MAILHVLMCPSSLLLRTLGFHPVLASSPLAPAPRVSLRLAAGPAACRARSLQWSCRPGAGMLSASLRIPKLSVAVAAAHLPGGVRTTSLTHVSASTGSGVGQEPAVLVDNVRSMGSLRGDLSGVVRKDPKMFFILLIHEDPGLRSASF